MKIQASATGFVDTLRSLWERITASMGLKIMIGLTGVISVFLLLCSFFIVRMMIEGQYRALETRGRELGMFFSRAITDALLKRDHKAIDELTAQAAQTEAIVYTLVINAAGKVVNKPARSFNSARDEGRRFLSLGPDADPIAFVAALKQEEKILEIDTAVTAGPGKLATVKMGFSSTEARAESRRLIWMLAGTGVIIVGLLVLMMSIMVRKLIVMPTRHAVSVVSSIARGDLSRRVDVGTRDELGMLGEGVNAMISDLAGMIKNIRESARKTQAAWQEARAISSEMELGSSTQAESVEKAASSISEMHASLKQIAGTVDDLYLTSEQTSSSVLEMAASTNEVQQSMAGLSSAINETSSAIERLSGAVNQIAENVQNLSDTADETAASATEISTSVKEVEAGAKESEILAEAVAEDAQQLGMPSIEKTIEGMGRIETIARRTAETIDRLGERAESAGGILTVIEDITDQTSLLALNAAILAAQAGEHGRGFAVVAAEIRELANRTAASTQEIGKLIAAVQEESRAAVAGMRDEVTMVAEGVSLAREAGEALKKIVSRADQSRTMSRGITRATTEQARGIRQVSEAIVKITGMTHEIARSAYEQKQVNEQITLASEKMRELTKFVAMSMESQARGSREITSIVETMNTKTAMVNRASGEMRNGSDMIVQAIDRIKEIAKKNADNAVSLNNALEIMMQQSETLKKEIEQFRT